jgi:hypothetical protein
VIRIALAFLLLLAGCTQRSREAAPGEGGSPDTSAVPAVFDSVPPPPDGPRGPAQLLSSLHRQADQAVFVEALRLALVAGDRDMLAEVLAVPFTVDGTPVGRGQQDALFDRWDRDGGFDAVSLLVGGGVREIERGVLVFPASWDGNPASPHGRLVPTPPGWTWDSVVLPRRGN